MRTTCELKLYTVVEVWRGFATSAKNFRRLRNAEKYARRLRKVRDSAGDDVQLFECPVRLSPRNGLIRSNKPLN
jgi:hypothetical protein